MATLRTAAMNLLKLAGFRSIRTGIQAVMHDITVLLVMARRLPKLGPAYDFESALGVEAYKASQQRRLMTGLMPGQAARHEPGTT